MIPAAFICFDCETRATTRPEIIEAIRLDGATYAIATNRAKAEKEAWAALGPDGQFQWRLGQTALGPHAELLCVTARHADRDGAGEVSQWDPFGRDNGAVPLSVCGRPGVGPEAELLAELTADWTEAADSDTVWIGHNVRAFDVPLLLRRFAFHRIEPPPSFPLFYRGRPRGRIFDTMNDPPYGTATPYITLGAACRAFGIRPPADDNEPGGPLAADDDAAGDRTPSAASPTSTMADPPSPSTTIPGASRFQLHCVARWLADGEFDKILAHNADDERATFELFWRVTHAGRLGCFQFADDAEFEAWLATLRDINDLERDGYRYRHYTHRRRAAQPLCVSSPAGRRQT